MLKPFFLILYLSAVSLSAQFGPGSWQEHLSINYCNTLAKLGESIYASNKNGIVKFNEEELSPESLTKINGLSDVGIHLLRTNLYNNKLLVVYDNCNIDVIDLNGTIKNYPNFKLKIINGKKVVNEVTFYNQYAYLSCGFGIVVFDTEKLEIKETFIIGTNASDIDVYQVALNDSLIFAATPKGLYTSNHKLKVLNNYNSWKLDTFKLPSGPYVGVLNVGGKILTCYAPSKINPLITGKDTLYLLENNTWIKYPPTANSGNTIKKIGMSKNELFAVIDQFGFLVRDLSTGKPKNYVTSFNGEPIDIVDGYFGINYASNMMYWLADRLNGLYQTYSYYPAYTQDKIVTNGINKPIVNNIDVYGGKVAISPSHPDDAGATNYIDQGLNILYKDQWNYILPRDFDDKVVKDITHVLIDKKDETVFWASTWFNGLLKYKANKLVKIYDPTNSTMPQVIPGNPRCTGLSMDKEGNLWLANSDVSNFLSVVKKNGDFQNFNFNTAKFTRKILVDKNNYVWALHERDGGITVYNHTNFSAPQLNINYKVLTKDVNNGNLETNAIFSIAEDKDGKIWVGTALGVRVFYNPTAIFTSSNFDAQPIKIIQDGNVEFLLGKEVVTSITVDGANNKWMGTQTGGLYCFSPDGITQLYHFTKDNSPLYSNNVVDVNYDEVTGDVFIGTEIGLQSYRSFVISGELEYKTIYAYPNPVRPNYTGNVFVKGLIDNSVVKIVDESGNLVWETKSIGGQVAWPITTLAGNRVATGVYIVYATSTDGVQQAITKIVVIN